MRIAYLLKKFPRLSETFILNEVLAQEALGDAVHVYSRREPDDEPRHPALRDHRGEVHVLPSTRRIDPWRVLFQAGRAEEILSSLREVTEDLGELVGEKLPSLIAEALFLLERTRTDGIDHVHVHFATDSAITALILARLGGPGFSLTCHAKDIYRETVQPALLDVLVKESTFTVTVCDANVEHMRAMISEEASLNLRRLYNGIDLESFKPAPAAPKSREILAVGRLVEKKGFNVLLEALADLRSSGLEFHATIVGTGDDAEALREQASTLKLDDVVEFTGPRDQEFVRDAMRTARVFCLPCVVGADGNRDALPTVLVEAIALGLPCVSTPVTGIPEILGEGPNAAGLIVPEHDPTSTARAIARLFEDDALWGAARAAGPVRAGALFDRHTQAAVLRSWMLESSPARAELAG